MDLTRLPRVLRLIIILQSGRFYNADELAGKLSVCRRTIFRDLKLLYKAGFPCYHDDEAGGYRMNKSCFLPPFNLRFHEALALLILVEHGAGPCGLPLLQSAQEGAIKIENVLPEHIQQQCESLLKNVSVRLIALSRHEHLQEIFQLLQQAIRRQRKVEMVYISFFEHKQILTTLSPYHLHFAQGAWWIIGHSSKHDQVLIFKLGRIKDIKMLSSIYLCGKPFCIDKFLGNAWSLIPEGKIYHVKLLFKPMASFDVAEVRWHRTQKLTWHDDGTLTFEVKVDGLNEITWWIMGYGDQVQVLDPTCLQEKITRIAQNMVEVSECGEVLTNSRSIY